MRLIIVIASLAAFLWLAEYSYRAKAPSQDDPGQRHAMRKLIEGMLVEFPDNPEGVTVYTHEPDGDPVKGDILLQGRKNARSKMSLVHPKSEAERGAILASMGM